MVISKIVTVIRNRNIFIMDTSLNISLQDLLKQKDCCLPYVANVFAGEFKPMVVSIIVSQVPEIYLICLPLQWDEMLK